VPFVTMSTGTIRGGTATNIVPRECEFQFDLRYLPGTSADATVARVRRLAEEELAGMRRVAPDAGIALELAEEAPDLDTAADAAITRLGARLSGSGAPGRVPFATDGGHFHRAGVPTIVIGPGSIDQAHKPNEFIALEQIAQCERFLERLKEELCAEAHV
jgi:acetylornithine deacetylase